MSPIHPSWLLRGLGAEWLIVQPGDAPRDPGLEPLPLTFVLGYLDAWLLDPVSRGVLVEIYAALFGHLRLGTWGYTDVGEAIRPALHDAFEHEDLVVLADRRLEGAQPKTQPGRPTSERPPPPSVRPRQPKTFIEIELFDSDDQPVPNEAFVITTPDGERRHGRLNERGFARIEGIDPGTCDVEFPNIDGREWGPRPFR